MIENYIDLHLFKEKFKKKIIKISLESYALHDEWSTTLTFEVVVKE